ncbi:MAG: hypothetical protein ACK554_10105, partial [Erythrobacteraceae bacterium]
GAATDIVENGTFVNNSTFAPMIGMDRRGLLVDRTQRRRQGLPDELRKEAKTLEEQALITDLFERITIYDLKAGEAASKQRADGKWVTRITIEAGKFTADGKGIETPAKLSESIEVGAFTARPGTGVFAKADVLAIQRSPIRAGTQRVEIVTAKKPAFAGVDPYNFYIDRNSDDNVVAVD